MKQAQLLITLAVVGVAILAFIAYWLVRSTSLFKASTPVPTPTPVGHPTTTPQVITSATPSVKPSPSVSPKLTPGQVSQVNLYLIAISDEGKSGTKIGCGDSVIGVVRKLDKPSATPLNTAITELLSIKTQYYGQSGLYNALYQSNLKLDSATLKDGVATVYLSGNLVLGGVCDNPRVEAQLTQAVLQFPSVRAQHIYINNRPLHDVVSER